MPGERISEGIPEKSNPRECGEEITGKSTEVLSTDGVGAVIIWSGARVC